MHYCNITLHYLNADGIEDFPSRHVETMKEARRMMKEEAKDKEFFNRWSETDDAWEDVAQISIQADGNVITEIPTAWADQLSGL